MMSHDFGNHVVTNGIIKPQRLVQFEGEAVITFKDGSSQSAVQCTCVVTSNGVLVSRFLLRVWSEKSKEHLPITSKFFCGPVPSRVATWASHRLVPLKSIIVTTRFGTLSAHKVTWHSFPLLLREEVRFEGTSSIWSYSANSDGQPVYWAAPITNLLDADVVINKRQHPLKMKHLRNSFPKLSPTESRQAKALERLAIRAEIGEVPFESAWGKAAIEIFGRPLAAYTSTEDPITARAYGDFKGDSLSPRTFASTLGHALTFSLGKAAYVPWVEFYDEDLNLLSISGALFPRERAFHGHGFILNATGLALSTFLSVCFFSSHLGTPELFLCMRNVVRATDMSLPVRDRMLYLASASEFLFRLHHIESDDPRNRLTPEARSSVLAIYNNARASVRKLSRENRGTVSGEALNTIFSRLSNLFNKEHQFGKCLTTLLQKSGFHDFEVMLKHPGFTAENYYWPTILTILRGQMVHGNILPSTYDKDELDQLLIHLADINARFILDTIGYRGRYLSPLTRHGKSSTINWVQASFNPREMGYS